MVFFFNISSSFHLDFGFRLSNYERTTDLFLVGRVALREVEAQGAGIDPVGSMATLDVVGDVGDMWNTVFVGQIPLRSEFPGGRTRTTCQDSPFLVSKLLLSLPDALQSLEIYDDGSLLLPGKKKELRLDRFACTTDLKPPN